jgi:hypothetical protein
VKRIAVVTGVLAAAAGLAGAAAGAAVRPTYLPARCGVQAIRPATVTPCNQLRRQLIALRWSRWGRPRATATGSLLTNTCVPDCPSGASEIAEVRVTADRLRHCRNGTRQYTRVRYVPVVAGETRPRSATMPCP